MIGHLKYEVICKWPIPKLADELKRFVAFLNFSKRLLQNFAEIAKPLNKLLKKNAEFTSTEDCQSSYEELPISFASRSFTKGEINKSKRNWRLSNAISVPEKKS